MYYLKEILFKYILKLDKVLLILQDLKQEISLKETSNINI